MVDAPFFLLAIYSHIVYNNGKEKKGVTADLR